MSKLQSKLHALQARLNRYISKSVKATKQMIIDLIFQIAKLERKIEFLNQPKLSQDELIKLIIKEIEKDDEMGTNCTANKWQKYGKTRIYLGKYNGRRINQYGYIDFLDNRIEIVKTNRNSGSTVINKAKLALQKLNLQYSYFYS